MEYALDIFVIIAVIVFAVIGYKKGIIKTIISLVGSILASLMSIVLSKPIAEAVYNAGIKPTVISKSESALKLVGQEGGSFAEKLMDTLPGFVKNSIGKFGITTVDISSASQHGAAQIERTLAPIFISFISVIVSVILFIIFIIIVKIVCKLVYNAVDSGPLNVIDSLSGAVIGIAEGFVIVLIVAFIIRISSPHMKNVPEIISNDSISQSTVFKGIYNSPILTGLVSMATNSPNTNAVE